MSEVTLDSITYANRAGTFNYTLDIPSVPTQSIKALIARGLSHVLGNEAMSRAAGRYEAEAKRLEVAELSDEQKEAMVATARAEMVDAIVNGTLGVRTEGEARVTPLEAMCVRLAKVAIVEQLKKATPPIAFPKAVKDGPVPTITIGGVAVTMDDLVTRRLAHDTFGPAIRKAAETAIRQEEKRKADAKKSTVDATSHDAVAAALGL